MDHTKNNNNEHKEKLLYKVEYNEKTLVGF